MRTFAFAIIAGLICLVPAASSDAASLIDFVGFSWESSGFPTSNAGDQLELVARVDGLTNPLSWNPAVNEYTMSVAGLTSLGAEAPDPQNIVVSYVGGQFGIYEDNLLSGSTAAPGINPPNATAPTSYQDGASFLLGDTQEFTIFYNTQFQSGAFEASVLFTGGDHHGELGAQTIGYTFGGVFIFGTPEGYDLQWDGQILLEPVPVEPTTWGDIKSQFR